MQLKEGGAVEVEEIVAVTMGPEQRRARAAQGRLARRRPLGPSHRRGPRRLRRQRHRLRARPGARAGEPDLVLLGQQSDDGECYTIGAVVADHLEMPSLTQVIKIDVEDGSCAASARPSTATTRSRSAAGRHLRRRRDQRAALPVAEGDHGREEEAAGDAAVGDAGIEADRVGDDNARAHCKRLQGPAREGKPAQIIEDEDTNETVEKIVAWLDERKLLDERNPGLRPALRGRLQQELAGRRLRGRAAGRRARQRVPRDRRRRGPTSPTTSCALGTYGATKVFRAKGPEGLAQPVVDAMAKVIEDTATTTRSSAAACSASRSAPASPRAWTPA